MKPKHAPLNDGSRTFGITETLLSRKPVLALLMRLLCAVAFVLPAFCGQAGAVLTSLHSFDSKDGANPSAALVQGADGYFYGTTQSGGLNSAGTVFKVSANGTLTNLYSFNYKDGANPGAGLVQGGDGFLYGTTSRGGTNANGYGTVFQISTNGALTSLNSFGSTQDVFGVPFDGGVPNAPLVQATNGVFYGTCSYGGSNDSYPGGTIFQISTNGGAKVLWSFTGASDGSGPEAGLVRGSDGSYYGTTSGSYGIFGGVFKFTPPGAVTGLYSFTGGADGGSPWAALVEGSDGLFYGTTVFGGTYSNGTVFCINTGGALTNLYSFTGGTDGGKPYCNLVQGSDGYFYGTTASGGTHTNGTVFRVSAGGKLTSLYSFTGGTDGGKPYAGLVQGSDGNFYGTTLDSGTNGYGTVFRLTVGPTFQPVTLNNGTVNLTWIAEAGKTYQLQFNSDLSTTNWVNLGGVLTATAATLSFNDYPTNGPTRFYRVVLSP